MLQVVDRELRLKSWAADFFQSSPYSRLQLLDSLTGSRWSRKLRPAVVVEEQRVGSAIGLFRQEYSRWLW